MVVHQLQNKDLQKWLEGLIAEAKVENK